tara:strand:- start:1268 stop:1807 length:540 start_codon:yes stop_codon:yes gene_type:complete
MLELLSTKHEDWIRIGYSMTGDIDKAKDLVQDMYIRLHRLGKTREDVAYRDTVNRYFIWTVLFNMYRVSMRTKVHKKIDTCELLGDEEMECFEYDVSRDDASTTMIEVISKTVSEWSQYDRKLFELYFLRGQSLRQIANGAGIGLTSIHNSVKSYKATLKEGLLEDLQDYFNQDYDKIV